MWYDPGMLLLIFRCGICTHLLFSTHPNPSSFLHAFSYASGDTPRLFVPFALFVYRPFFHWTREPFGGTWILENLLAAICLMTCRKTTWVCVYIYIYSKYIIIWLYELYVIYWIYIHILIYIYIYIIYTYLYTLYVYMYVYMYVYAYAYAYAYVHVRVLR